MERWIRRIGAGCVTILLPMLGACQNMPARVGVDANGKQVADKSRAGESGVSSHVSPATHLAAGRFHESQNQIHTAIEQYRMAIQLDPKFAEAHNCLGVILTRQAKYEQAENYLKEAVRLAPGKAHVRNNLAFYYISRQRWSDAEAELRNAIQINPKFTRAQVNLGLVLAQQRKFEESLAVFRHVLTEADAQFNMGLMYQSLGEYPEAAQAYQAAMKVNPKLVAAQKRYDVIKDRASEMEQQRKLKPVAQAPTTRPAEVAVVEPASESEHATATTRPTVKEVAQAEPNAEPVIAANRPRAIPEPAEDRDAATPMEKADRAVTADTSPMDTAEMAILAELAKEDAYWLNRDKSVAVAEPPQTQSFGDVLASPLVSDICDSADPASLVMIWSPESEPRMTFPRDW